MKDKRLTGPDPDDQAIKLTCHAYLPLSSPTSMCFVEEIETCSYRKMHILMQV